jgi:hypothetical protein
MPTQMLHSVFVGGCDVDAPRAYTHYAFVPCESYPCNQKPCTMDHIVLIPMRPALHKAVDGKMP